MPKTYQTIRITSETKQALDAARLEYEHKHKVRLSISEFIRRLLENNLKKESEA